MIESELPDEFEGYDQRPCPSCGHVDGHYPIGYTETMVVLCSECQYEFVKRPANLETLEMDATSNDELRQLIDEIEEYSSLDVDRFASELKKLIEYK